jgi:uncharacterized protein YcfJ
MNSVRKSALQSTALHGTPFKATLLALSLLGGAAHAQITFYENEGFRGRAFTADRAVADFSSQGFNDRASSVVVQSGRWEVCENSRYGGACVTLRPGSYASLGGMGLNDALSSTRPAGQRRAGYEQAPDAPPPQREPDYAWRRRPGEAVYTVPVSWVREVQGTPNERCWIERQPAGPGSDINPGRALLGAVLGGVIGHQIGGGTGRDLATAGGAVAGAVIGGKSGGGEGGMQDVRRCDQPTASTPAYWSVGYDFRGVQHQVQMASAPGRTITVNAAGEPRQ